MGHGRPGALPQSHPLLHPRLHRGRRRLRHHQRQLVPPDVQVDRRRQDGARLRRHHHVGGQQDRPVGQASGVHGGGRAQGQGAQRHVHRDVGQGRIQCEAVVSKGGRRIAGHGGHWRC